MPNIGPLDRILRLVVGAALVAVSLPLEIDDFGWHWIGLLGALLIVTAAYRHCPAYQWLGVSTGGRPGAARSRHA